MCRSVYIEGSRIPDTCIDVCLVLRLEHFRGQELVSWGVSPMKTTCRGGEDYSMRPVRTSLLGGVDADREIVMFLLKCWVNSP